MPLYPASGFTLANTKNNPASAAVQRAQDFKTVSSGHEQVQHQHVWMVLLGQHRDHPERMPREGGARQRVDQPGRAGHPRDHAPSAPHAEQQQRHRDSGCRLHGGGRDEGGASECLARAKGEPHAGKHQYEHQQVVVRAGHGPDEEQRIEAEDRRGGHRGPAELAGYERDEGYAAEARERGHHL